MRLLDHDFGSSVAAGLKSIGIICWRIVGRYIELDVLSGPQYGGTCRNSEYMYVGPTDGVVTRLLFCATISDDSAVTKHYLASVWSYADVAVLHEWYAGKNVDIQIFNY